MIRETDKRALSRLCFFLRTMTIFFAIAVGSMCFFSVQDELYRGIDPGILLFIVPVFTFIGALGYIVKRLESTAWKIQADDSGLIVDTVKKQFSVGWESFAAVENCAMSNTYSYRLSLRDGTKLDLPSVLDKDGALLRELRSRQSANSFKSEAASAFYRLPMSVLIHWLLAMPMMAFFLSGMVPVLTKVTGDLALKQTEAVGGGMALGSIIAVLIFVCTSIETKGSRVVVRSALCAWEFSWDQLKLGKFDDLKTPIGTLVAAQLSDYDQLKHKILERAEKAQKAGSPIEKDSAFVTLRSPAWPLCILSVVLLAVPLAHSIWFTVTVCLLAMLDFVRPSRNLLRSAFCALAIVTTAWTVAQTPASSDLNKTVIVRCMEVVPGGQNPSEQIQMGKPERIQQFEITPLAFERRYQTNIPGSFEYLSWIGPDSWFRLSTEEFFGVDDAPMGALDKPAADSNTALVLENAKWDAPRKFQHAGMTFTERRCHTKYSDKYLAGVEYVAMDNGKRVVVRLVGDAAEEDELFERAKATLQTLHRVSVPHIAATVQQKAHADKVHSHKRKKAHTTLKESRNR